MNYPKISVLMSLYARENPAYFDCAMESVYLQTMRDFEVVLVIDGPISEELWRAVEGWRNRLHPKMRVFPLRENVKLPAALNAGLIQCNAEYVARFDTDDYSYPRRLEIQYMRMKENPSLDVCGSYMAEFETDPLMSKTVKIVPVTHSSIVKKMYWRNPINHPSVMFKKKSVVDAGGYKPILYCEDYDLWVRLMIRGATFENIDTPLVAQRVNLEQAARRGGVVQLRSEIAVRRRLLDNRQIHWTRFGIQCVLQFMVRLLIPKRLRFAIFRMDRMLNGKCSYASDNGSI